MAEQFQIGYIKKPKIKRDRKTRRFYVSTPPSSLKHGMVDTPEYNSWRAMRKRCVNPNEENYKWYGGRGISVCSEWMTSFQNFYSDMGERPEGMTLDRIDPDGNYEPSNCRWSDYKTQTRNRRMNR